MNNKQKKVFTANKILMIICLETTATTANVVGIIEFVNYFSQL